MENKEKGFDEDSEMWEEHRKERQQKKQRNREQSLNILRKNGVYFQCLSDISGHYRVGEFDFWPSTGKYIERSTKKHGRGVFNLLEKVGKNDTRFCEKHNGMDQFDTVLDCNECSFLLED